LRRGPRGKDALDRKLPGLAAGARHGGTILVLRDLDADAPCAGELVARLVQTPVPGLLLRVAVRSIEAWLMADREAIAQALRIPAKLVPRHAEALDHPKSHLRKLGRGSRDAATRATFESGTDQQVAGWVGEFIQTRWDPMRAARTESAPSLGRALRRLQARSGPGGA
jgi:hypothetical protein